ncbi:Serine/threonine-protein kinase RIO1 [Orchesella cincta]|uniref:Serine/threonine-protein kinase RIO1 n=1 Tax=Orchesella cincta TaxID=48709 RepID=A0A1D2NEM4_ORCCI|nr:Serine/threonine-protein kinase RIO1 [Orchesella cincta]
MASASTPPGRYEYAGYSEQMLEGAYIPWKPTEHPVCDGQFDDDEDDEGVETTITVGKEVAGSASQSGSVPSGGGVTNAYTRVEGAEDINSEEEDDEDTDYSEGYDEDDYQFWDERNGPNCQSNHKNLQTSDELFRKFSSKISVEKYEGVENLPSGAGNKILSTNKRALGQRVKVKDKQDRATVEQVLDPRTRMILYKLLSSGKIVSIDGCISTGKEANVYHATGPDNSALAIKIFKTSILTFKARDKYVSGEFRFRQGYCKKNPRKMVRLWAEKEFRNLQRIHTTGMIKSHVLVMDFIGEDGWPCPLLKDVKFNEIEFNDNEQNSDQVAAETSENDPVLNLVANLYKQCLVILYRLFNHCKLVHADFSEFNLILKDNKELYVIDVSQSVEHDHPRSLDFLRHDIKNVQEFFGKHILVGDYKDIFEFITSPTVDDSNCDAVLDGILKNAKKLESFNVSDEVFRQTHIPRKMQEVVDYERDYQKMKMGETELVYTKIMGMKSDMSGPEVVNRICSRPQESSSKVDDSPQTPASAENKENADRDGDDESESDTETVSTSESEDEEGGKEVASRPKNETAEEKKLRKKQVKEEKAEKRKSKVKKHVKKRKEKLAHANSKR